MPAAAIAGAAVVGSVGSSLAAGSAAKKAAGAQTQAAQMGVDEQRRQFDAIQQLLAPYVQAGTPALQQMLSIAGVGGGQDWSSYLTQNPDVASVAAQEVAKGNFSSPEEYAQYHYNAYGRNEGRQVASTSAEQAQQSAIDGIESSPIFQALARQGETSILQNASATGGLRGGNVQGALSQFRPALLNQQIEQQYARLGGLTQLGQNSAAGVGNAGLQTGANIANLLGQAGAAKAGGYLAQGQATGQLFNLPSQALGAFMGAGGKF